MTDDPDLIPLTHAAGVGKTHNPDATYAHFFRLACDGEIRAVKLRNKLFVHRSDIPRAAAIIRERGWGARQRRSA